MHKQDALFDNLFFIYIFGGYDGYFVLKTEHRAVKSPSYFY